MGASFGTGADRIVIDPNAAGPGPGDEFDYVAGADDDQLRRFGGRRVLGADAILAARVLFGIAGASLALTLYLAWQAGFAAP